MRVLPAVIGTVLLGSSLSGCGSGNDDPEPLSKAELEEVLLTVDHLGDEFEAAEDDEDEDWDPGCLSEVAELDDEDQRAEALYRIDDRVDVNVAVLDYGSEADLEDAMTDVADGYEGCTTIDDTHEGIRFELRVSADTQAAHGVDQQVNSEITGTLTFEGQTVPLHVSIRAARIDDYMLGVAFVSVAEADDAADLLMEAAIDRFEAVRDGEDPPQPKPLLGDYIESLDLGQSA